MLGMAKEPISPAISIAWYRAQFESYNGYIALPLCSPHTDTAGASRPTVSHKLGRSEVFRGRE